MSRRCVILLLSSSPRLPCKNRECNWIHCCSFNTFLSIPQDDPCLHRVQRSCDRLAHRLTSVVLSNTNSYCWSLAIRGKYLRVIDSGRCSISTQPPSIQPRKRAKCRSGSGSRVCASCTTLQAVRRDSRHVVLQCLHDVMQGLI